MGLLMKMGIVEIKWLDSCGYGDWHDSDALYSIKPETITSLGYVAERRDEYIVITSSISDNKNNQGTLAIPTSAILEIHYCRRIQ